VNLNSPIPVRFSADITARLKEVSDNSGIPLSHLVRIATEQYLDQIETSRTVTITLKKPLTPPSPKKKSSGKSA
jgi:predicted DNA-binding protein